MSNATGPTQPGLEVAQGSGELRDPPKNGKDLLFTSSTAKAKAHWMELAEAKHRSKEGVVHPVSPVGSRELLAKGRCGCRRFSWIQGDTE